MGHLVHVNSLHVPQLQRTPRPDVRGLEQERGVEGVVLGCQPRRFASRELALGVSLLPLKLCPVPSPRPFRIPPDAFLLMSHPFSHRPKRSSSTFLRCCPACGPGCHVPQPRGCPPSLLMSELGVSPWESRPLAPLPPQPSSSEAFSSPPAPLSGLGPLGPHAAVSATGVPTWNLGKSVQRRSVSSLQAVFSHPLSPALPRHTAPRLGPTLSRGDTCWDVSQSDRIHNQAHASSPYRRLLDFPESPSGIHTFKSPAGVPRCLPDSSHCHSPATPGHKHGRSVPCPPCPAGGVAAVPVSSPVKMRT